ncbi:hypothetical protein EDB87DRAFT_1341305 [Lactarius vividus]|nr:hypothetical protein EDB87DRAFT_1341305 [Lactarius vividus]
MRKRQRPTFTLIPLQHSYNPANLPATSLPCFATRSMNLNSLEVTTRDYQIFSPAKVISAGVGVLLLAAKDVDASQEALADLFERIENFFKRLESYTEVPPTDAMTDMIVKIMVEVLNIFAIATKEMKQGRAKKFFKKLVGRKDIEDALARLDKLTQDEARMAAAQILRMTHSVDDRVKIVDDKVTGVQYKLKDVDDKMDIVLNGTSDAC